MDTSHGAFSLTDGGLNVSSMITDKFRIGAQLYTRNIGEIGRGHVNVDWALGDYKLTDWFGVRVGKVKTALGLLNDTQDNEFLHTWAILPQSVYPLDLRASTIAHTGGDVYGEVSLPKLGTLGYTVYLGTRPDDRFGGYRYNISDIGAPVQRFTGSMAGYDLRWNTPVAGLVVGTSWMNQTEHVNGITLGPQNTPYTVNTHTGHITSGYGDYTRGRLHVAGEFRRTYKLLDYQGVSAPPLLDESEKGWFLSAAYRLTKRFEIGTYHSRYYQDHPAFAGDPNSNHIFDQTVTARFDVRNWWNMKVEGHFIDGYGDIVSARGFYTRSNPTGFQPNTNLLVIRTGFIF
jgi:hypothetical protein